MQDRKFVVGGTKQIIEAFLDGGSGRRPPAWNGRDSLRPLLLKVEMRKLLKKIWSGRVDSNHRPPGPEPGDRRFAGFCSGMLIFHIVPVQLVSSISCAPLVLHGMRSVADFGCTKRARKGQNIGRSRIAKRGSV